MVPALPCFKAEDFGRHRRFRHRRETNNRIRNSPAANVLVDDNGLVVDAAAGAVIGPGGKFGKGQSFGMMFTYGNGTWSFRAHGTLKEHRGNLNLRDVNYVGFEFLLAGKVHYGWARLQVKFVRRQYYQTKAHIHILGYGYETTPNTAIAAGSCSAEAAPTAGKSIGNSNKNADPTIGETVSIVPKTAALGMLAAGSVALPLWRKDSQE
jgi:hypothetical protein